MGPRFAFSTLASFSAVALCSITLARSARAADNPPSPGKPLATAPASETVTVTLRADDGNATLEKKTSVQSYSGLPLKDAGLFAVATWEPACVAPCVAKLDPRFAYRVAGEGLVPSESFTLARGRNLSVDAKMGSAYGRLGGAALGVAGGAGVLLGGAALIATPILESQNVGSSTFRTGLLAGGVVVAGAGAIALVTGIWLWLHNDTTIEKEPAIVAGRSLSPVRMTASGLVF